MRGIDLRGVFGVWECLILCQRGLGGVFRVWVGLILCQRGLGGFKLQFKNRFLFGLKKVEGFGLGIWPAEGTSLCLGLLKSMGFGFEAWPTEGSTSITLDQLIPHLP